jgi:hypothetical protein
LFSTIDKSFYNQKDFYKIIEQNCPQKYAELLMISQGEYDSIKVKNCKKLNELRILFLYLMQFNCIDQIKEIFFYEAPDFLIIMKDNSIIGLEVTNILVDGYYEFEDLSHNGEIKIEDNSGLVTLKTKCYTYDISKLENKKIEDNICDHILKKLSYIDNIKNNIIIDNNNIRIQIHYFFYDQIFGEYERKEFFQIYDKHKKKFKELSINPETDFYFNKSNQKEQSNFLTYTYKKNIC